MFVYVAYRFNDKDAGKVLANIGVAHRVGYEFIKQGDYPIIPHADFQMALMFGRKIPFEYYYKSTMGWMERCDAIAIVIDGEPLSSGVVAELKRAIQLKKPVYRAFVNPEMDKVVIEPWEHPVAP
jgi:hypothetical protein